MWILTGLVVFEEAKFYSNSQLWIIAGSCCLCFVGVKFLTMKTKMLKAVKKEKETFKATLTGQDEETAIV